MTTLFITRIGCAIALSATILLTTTGGCTAQAIENAVAAYHRGDYTVALQLFRQLAERGNAKAQSYVGSMYFVGYGAPQNYGEAAKWYRLAAEQGLVDAQVSLAQMYGQGMGVPRDPTQEVHWYRRAAAQDNVHAQWMLALILENGWGCRRTKLGPFTGI